MTIGIYCLHFEGTDKVYIGQSINIENRFHQHLRSFENGTASKKLFEACALYGLPKLLVLTECDTPELDQLENMAMDLYDSINNGFNRVYKVSEGTPRLTCEDNPNSKYTKSQIIDIFLRLVDGTTINVIHSITGIPIHTISSISSCNAHKWLKALYPTEYLALELRKSVPAQDRVLSAEARNIQYPLLYSPEGVGYVINNINKFCREHSLHPGNLHSVLTGKRATHKGWTVSKE